MGIYPLRTVDSGPMIKVMNSRLSVGNHLLDPKKVSGRINSLPLVPYSKMRRRQKQDSHCQGKTQTPFLATEANQGGSRKHQKKYQVLKS